MSGDLPAALMALAGAVAAWPPTGSQVRARLVVVRAGSGDAARPGSGRPAAEDPGATRRRRRLLAAGAGVGGGLVVGGVAGLVFGLALAVAAERLLRGAGGPDDADRRALIEELPVACDLLAVCLARGLPLGGALAAVAAAVPGPLGSHLTHVAGLYRLGADSRRAWAGVPGELAGLGRVLVRAGESGSAVGSALRSLAAEARAAARAATEAAVRRAGVWVLAPLGLCFLPAFVCLGVAPLVLGIAGDVFG